MPNGMIHITKEDMGTRISMNAGAWHEQTLI
jgi:hypothetical protein